MIRNKLLIGIVILTSTCILSQEKLEVDGMLILQNSATSNPIPGTIRWTGTEFQGYNGTKWISLISRAAYDGEVTDRDGNVYQTIKIGTQEWMVQNLRTSKYRNGDAIANLTDNIAWSNASSGAWCWYDHDSKYELPYGKLYNWHAVNDGRGLCPDGWKVPSDSEWTTLINFLGGINAGGSLKGTGTGHWTSPNTGSTNSSGLTGLPGGYRSFSGSFFNISYNSYWWSSSSETSTGNFTWYRSLSYSNVSVNRNIFNWTYGLSVRCIKG